MDHARQKREVDKEAQVKWQEKGRSMKREWSPLLCRFCGKVTPPKQVSISIQFTRYFLSYSFRNPTSQEPNKTGEIA